MNTHPTDRLQLPPAPRPPHMAPAGVAAMARDIFGRETVSPTPQQDTGMFGPQSDPAKPAARREKATDALGRRVGALLDEIDFPTFVSSLIDGTFNAIVDSSIRQMEAYADLVAAVAKPLDQFTQENVTRNQARDWLVEQYPSDVALLNTGQEYRLSPRATNPDEISEPPAWLADFGLDGEELSEEFLEETLLPVARERVAQQRLSTLATMVLTGMNRVVVRDGSIGARLRFRASAADTTALEFATSNDPTTGATEWGRRATQPSAITKVSTVGVNAQSDTELEARLYGDVKINFASETVPLDRFVDQAQQSLLERHSRGRQSPQRSAGNQPQSTPTPVEAAPVPAPDPQLPPPPTQTGGNP